MSPILQAQALMMARHTRDHVIKQVIYRFHLWTKHELRGLPFKANTKHHQYATLKARCLVNGAAWEDPRFLASYGESDAEVRRRGLSL